MNNRGDGAARVIAISGDAMGRGDEELGRVLLRSYLHTLTEVVPRPDTVIFFNHGVRLAVEGSPAVEDLLTLVEQGVRLLLCGTCVDALELKGKIAVGEISNMYAISETMLRAASVINI
jgi:selenium metabolism protein YedF